jgi:hypothetical protein
MIKDWFMLIRKYKFLIDNGLNPYCQITIDGKGPFVFHDFLLNRAVDMKNENFILELCSIREPIDKLLGIKCWEMVLDNYIRYGYSNIEKMGAIPPAIKNNSIYIQKMLDSPYKSDIFRVVKLLDLGFSVDGIDVNTVLMKCLKKKQSISIAIRIAKLQNKLDSLTIKPALRTFCIKAISATFTYKDAARIVCNSILGKCYLIMKQLIENNLVNLDMDILDTVSSNKNYGLYHQAIMVSDLDMIKRIQKIDPQSHNRTIPEGIAGDLALCIYNAKNNRKSFSYSTPGEVLNYLLLLK